MALGPNALPEALASGAQIVSVSTDSREVAPEAATAAVRAALAKLPAGIQMFKKVDSRLKGNVAAELDAIAHRRSLVVAAIPEFGRFTRDGRILGFGVSEPIGVAQRLGEHAGRADIPDIEAQADIDRALEGSHDILIGARGLAEALARRMAPEATAPAITLPDSAAFCLIGSTDPITMGQLDHLRRVSREHLDLAAPNGVALASPSTASLTIVQAVPGATPASGRDVADALAASLKRLDPPDDALLVLSGGATAQAILEALGIAVLTVLGEAQPGLPIARARDLTVVTKSGGFGAPDCLSRLLSPYSSAWSRASHVG